MNRILVNKVELARALRSLREVMDEGDHRLKLGYSGRGMMSARCVALETTGPGAAALFVHFLVARLHENGQPAAEVLPALARMEMDNLGLDRVVYWPKLIHDPDSDRVLAEDAAENPDDPEFSWTDVWEEIEELGGMPEAQPA